MVVLAEPAVVLKLGLGHLLCSFKESCCCESFPPTTATLEASLLPALASLGRGAVSF